MTKSNQGNRWFGIDYHMNLYKGCPFGCIYCDSRCEAYHIDNFDEVRIKGSRAFYEIIKKAFEKGESFTSDIPMYYSDFSEGTDWQWNQLKNNLYNKCIKIGDSIIKNGSIMVYPKSESEIIAYNEKDFNSVPIDEVEYVVLRSNIKTDQMLMVDIERKKIMGTGFDELESLGLADEFNTSSFAQ